MMNTTRTVFGKHSQGYIFPMLLNVKPMDHSFAGIVQELASPEHFVLFTSKTFRVLEATLHSMKLMNVRVVVVHHIVCSSATLLLVMCSSCKRVSCHR